MAESTLDQVQRLVDQLSPHYQARLLAYVALRIAHVVTSTPPTASVTLQETAEAWQEFFRLGDALEVWPKSPELQEVGPLTDMISWPDLPEKRVSGWTSSIPPHGRGSG